MKPLKMLRLAGLSAMALMAFGVGTASATTLEIGGATQNNAVSITATIKSGNSTIWKDEISATLNTCAESEISGKTESSYSNGKITFNSFTGDTLTGAVTTLSFSKCTRSVTVHKNGTLHVSHTGTTDGTVTSSGTEVEVNTIFGYLNCKTNAGTHIGTLTAGTHASISINASLSCGIAANWSGTYSVTSPTGLGVSA